MMMRITKKLVWSHQLFGYPYHLFGDPRHLFFIRFTEFIGKSIRPSEKGKNQRDFVSSTFG